jgi:hypothetical protein
MKKIDSEAISANRQLRYLATDLHEVYSLLSELSLQLEGGGIVQARDVEPAVSAAVPRLRSAVETLYAASKRGETYGDSPDAISSPGRNPLLM